MATKKKLNKADFMFKSRQNEVLVKKPGDINGIDFMIKDLHDCTVHILDYTAQIQIDKCERTTFVIGPIKGSVFIRDCKECKVSVACSQFRCRDLYDSTIYLYAQNDPIIESSNNLVFAPFNISYPLLAQHAEAVGFNTSLNKWNLIFDFTLNQKGDSNFTVLAPEDWKFEHIQVEGFSEQPEVVFPYPQKYGGTLSDEQQFEQQHDDGGLMAFGFDTDQTQAQQIIEQQQQSQNQDFSAKGPMMSYQQNFQTEYYNQDQGDPFQTHLDQNNVFNANIQDGDFTQEELEQIRQVELDNQIRKQKIYEKLIEETKSKNEKKAKAQQTLHQWKEQQKKQIEQIKYNNQNEEQQKKENEKSEKYMKNPWQRVVDNIEINSSQYVGSRDVTRMRQSITARKNDFMKKAL